MQKLERSTDSGWSPMNAKCCIFGCFQKRMILLCQSICKTKRMPIWYSQDSFIIPLRYFTHIFLKALNSDVRLHIYRYIFMYLCICICIYINMYYMNFIYIYMCVCACVCVCVCVCFIYVYLCIYMYTYRLVKVENCKSINYISSNSFLIHTHKYTRFIHTYTGICINVYVHA